jgi:uncharacterized protein YjbI with pentapeptide repeats
MSYLILVKDLIEDLDILKSAIKVPYVTIEQENIITESEHHDDEHQHDEHHDDEHQHDTEQHDDKLSTLLDVSKLKSVHKVGLLQHNVDDDEMIQNITTLLESIKQFHNINVIDLLVCSIKSTRIREHIVTIERKYNKQIRYSTDETGNNIANGDWILESHEVNVKSDYFNDKINNWNYVLTHVSGTWNSPDWFNNNVTEISDGVYRINPDVRTMPIYAINSSTNNIIKKLYIPSTVKAMFFRCFYKVVFHKSGGSLIWEDRTDTCIIVGSNYLYNLKFVVLPKYIYSKYTALYVYYNSRYGESTERYNDGVNIFINHDGTRDTLKYTKLLWVSPKLPQHITVIGYTDDDSVIKSHQLLKYMLSIKNISFIKSNGAYKSYNRGSVWGTYYYNKNYTDTDQVSIDLSEIESVVFENVNISGLDFRNTDLSRVSFKNVSGTPTLPSGLTLTRNLIIGRGVLFKDLEFTGDYSDVNFEGTILSNVKFGPLSVDVSKLPSTEHHSIEYTDTNGTTGWFVIGPGTTLEGLNLYTADLSNKDLTGQNISGTDLSSVNLSGIKAKELILVDKIYLESMRSILLVLTHLNMIMILLQVGKLF